MEPTHTAPTTRVPRTSGGWFPGDPVGDRKFAHLGPIDLENGESLDVTVAYETWGTLNADHSNAVLVLHALTGDSHVYGTRTEGHPTSGWWPSLVGPGTPIDPDRYFIVCPNVLGGCQGTTGPSSRAEDGRPYGSRFPHVTIRDQVLVEHTLMDALGIENWALVVGGSMGGMRALEWAVTYPDQVERMGAFATSAYTSADVIAWNCAQLAAIEHSSEYAGGDYYTAGGRGPGEALGVARRIAHTTYRSAEEFAARFPPHPVAVGATRPRFDVESYLDYHATSLAARFDAGSYVALVKAMNSHDIGRGRGGVGPALARIRARTLIASIDTDRLFLPRDSEELAARITGSRHVQISSLRGHDAFLVDAPVLTVALQELLDSP